jgi:hypothetical protein
MSMKILGRWESSLFEVFICVLSSRREKSLYVSTNKGCVSKTLCIFPRAQL